MKKVLVFGIFIILALSLSSLASAAINLRQGSESLVQAVKDVFEPFLSSFLRGFSSDYILEFALFFLILLAFIYVILERVPIFRERKGAVLVITIAVSILATRFIAQESFVKLVLQPYNIMGVAILSLVPFIVYLFFIESFDSGAIRKMGWSLFIIIYIAMWYSSFEELGDLSWIYFFTAILGGILLLSDKKIQGWLARSLVKKGLDENIVRRIADIQKDIAKDIERLDQVSGNQRRLLNEAIDRKHRDLRRLSRSFG